jgi:hypothetical protein
VSIIDCERPGAGGLALSAMDRGVAIASSRTTRPTRGSDTGLLLKVVTVKPMIACWTIYHGSNWQAGRRLIISPAELMRMWPISTRVNKPEKDDAAIVEPIELAPDAA